jgi:hypothetical protein
MGRRIWWRRLGRSRRGRLWRISWRGRIPQVRGYYLPLKIVVLLRIGTGIDGRKAG